MGKFRTALDNRTAKLRLQILEKCAIPQRPARPRVTVLKLTPEGVSGYARLTTKQGSSKRCSPRPGYSAADSGASFISK